MEGREGRGVAVIEERIVSAGMGEEIIEDGLVTVVGGERDRKKRRSVTRFCGEMLETEDIVRARRRADC